MLLRLKVLAIIPALVLANWSTTPFAQGIDHPCAKGSPVIGQVESGTPLKVQLQGEDALFGLASLIIVDAKNANGAIRTDANVLIYNLTDKPDRYGRRLGQLFLVTPDSPEPFWYQGALLEAGLALFDGQGEQNDCTRAMLAAERLGQKSRAGKWFSSALESKSDDLQELKRLGGYFGIVRGRVISVGDRKRTLYLNFGRNWREDFTVIVPKTGKSAYKGSLSFLKNLAGKTIRVRGLLQQAGGPMIRVMQEAQIETEAFQNQD